VTYRLISSCKYLLVLFIFCFSCNNSWGQSTYEDIVLPQLSKGNFRVGPEFNFFFSLLPDYGYDENYKSFILSTPVSAGYFFGDRLEIGLSLRNTFFRDSYMGEKSTFHLLWLGPRLSYYFPIAEKLTIPITVGYDFKRESSDIQVLWKRGLFLGTGIEFFPLDNLGIRYNIQYNRRFVEENAITTGLGLNFYFNRKSNKNN